MLLMPRVYVVRQTGGSSYNLRTTLGNPQGQVNVIAILSGTFTGTTSTPAFTTGTGWVNGTQIYIENSATINGTTGTTG
jgi:hypothetical protein